jgi:hypothetical protein
VDQSAAQRQLLLHAAGKLSGRALGKRFELRRTQQLVDAPPPFLLLLREQATEEVDVLVHRQCGIEVTAEALRHVGDARTDAAAMRTVRHVAAERRDRPDWILRTPATSACTVDLPTPSGPMRPTMRPAGMIIDTQSSATDCP